MPKKFLAVTLAAALMSTTAIAADSAYHGAPMTLAANEYSTQSQYNSSQFNSGQYNTGYSNNTYNPAMNSSDYNRATPAAGNPTYRGDHSNRAPVETGYEAERSNNIENHVTHRTQPYHRDMSMNDYNKRLKTAFRGQTAIQPERNYND